MRRVHGRDHSPRPPRNPATHLIPAPKQMDGSEGAPKQVDGCVVERVPTNNPFFRLCLVGFLANIQPSEPYLTRYLIEDKNVCLNCDNADHRLTFVSHSSLAHGK
jgi:hypothetical protein